MEVPYNIFNYRREQCQHCPSPCEYRLVEPFLKEGDNKCPIHRFGAYQTFRRLRWRGAGDMVASVAQPIAGAIDTLSGGKTKLRGCGACAKRKEMLNQLIPFGANK